LERRLEHELEAVDNTLSIADNQMHSTLIGADSLASATAVATELEERKNALDRAASLAHPHDPARISKVVECCFHLTMSAAKVREHISRIQQGADES